MADLAALAAEITACRRCARLLRCSTAAAREPPRRFAGQTYWARPVPGFGDPAARLLVVGLAPAAHGGNRTGRVFTGDRSGDWLYGALHRAGFANQAASIRPGDGLALSGAYVSCVVRYRCVGYLAREIALLSGLRAIVALGGFAWDGVLRAAEQLGHAIARPRPRFGHAAEARLGPWQLVGSYHVSQQNTFTGRLTGPMLDQVFARARAACG